MEASANVREEKIITEHEAADFIKDGMTIAIGGFINCSHPMPLVRRIIKRGIKNLTIVGPPSSGLDLDLLVGAGSASRIVSAYFGAETITPISPISTMTTPNHIRSNPRASARGAKMGTVSMIRAKASMKQPPNRYIRIITTMMTEAGKERPPAQADSSKGTRVTAIK